LAVAFSLRAEMDLKEARKYSVILDLQVFMIRRGEKGVAEFGNTLRIQRLPKLS
jgi:hypothetical protein